VNFDFVYYSTNWGYNKGSFINYVKQKNYSIPSLSQILIEIIIINYLTPPPPLKHDVIFERPLSFSCILGSFANYVMLKVLLHFILTFFLFSRGLSRGFCGSTSPLFWRQNLNPLPKNPGYTPGVEGSKIAIFSVT